MTLIEILNLPRIEKDAWRTISLLQDKFTFCNDYALDLNLVPFATDKNFEHIKLQSLYKKMSTATKGHWIDVISYKGIDVILFLTAGEHGDDYKSFNVLDHSLLVEMMEFLRTLQPTPDYTKSSSTIIELQDFYNLDLNKIK